MPDLLARKIRVQLHITATRFEDRHQGDVGVDGLQQADSHSCFGGDALLAQEVRQPVAVPINFRIGHRFGFGGQCHVVGLLILGVCEEIVHQLTGPLRLRCLGLLQSKKLF